jgi:tetratricopeptide (TPR) repeat protein
MHAEASAAADLFTQGQTLLTQGDFDAALKAFASAARQDSKNQAYRDQYALVRRVIQMRQTLAKEENPQKWQETASALRAFYYDNRLYSQALPIDEQIYDRLKTPESAVMLARTRLELGQNTLAAQLLEKLSGDARTPQVEVLQALASARAGNLVPAKSVAQNLGTPENADAAMYFDVARLDALVGKHGASAGALTRCFEMTPPSRLDALKSLAKACKDLEPVLANADYAGVLATASKVKESPCSGGSGCGNCKLAGSCAKAGASSPPPAGEKTP